MYEKSAFLDFGFSRQGVDFSVRFFLVVLPAARLPGPPLAAASDAHRRRPRPCPRRLVVACAKFETQAISPRWHRLLITALRIRVKTYLYRDYPICTSLILRLCVIPPLPFQPFMLSNTSFKYVCIFC